MDNLTEQPRTAHESTTDHTPPTKQTESHHIKPFLSTNQVIGRDQEVKQLARHFTQVCEGANRPVLVYVSGCSGVGKSALVHTLKADVSKTGAYFISGKYDQLNKNTAYGSIRQAFESLIQQILHKSKRPLSYWQDRLRQALGTNGQVISDVIPSLENIIGKQPAVPTLTGPEAENRFNRVFQKFISAITSPDHPLVLFLDDLQWIDLASLRLITHVARSTELQHLLIITAYLNDVFLKTRYMERTSKKVSYRMHLPSTTGIKHSGT